MAQQVHLVVVYDTETKEFSVDEETTAARFDEGDTWDTVEDQWGQMEDAEWFDIKSELVKKLEK